MSHRTTYTKVFANTWSNWLTDWLHDGSLFISWNTWYGDIVMRWAVFFCVERAVFEIVSWIDACLVHLNKNQIWSNFVFWHYCLYSLLLHYDTIRWFGNIFHGIWSLEIHVTRQFDSIIEWEHNYIKKYWFVNYWNHNYTCWIKIY